jgi:hypothetical protein
MEIITQDLNERLDRIEAWVEKVEKAVRDETIDVDPKTLERLKQALKK